MLLIQSVGNNFNSLNIEIRSFKLKKIGVFQ